MQVGGEIGAIGLYPFGRGFDQFQRDICILPCMFTIDRGKKFFQDLVPLVMDGSLLFANYAKHIRDLLYLLTGCELFSGGCLEDLGGEGLHLG